MTGNRRRAANQSGLRDRDFRQIASNGFGDGLNSYAHTMAYFRGHLFVGTMRANLCGVRLNHPEKFPVWPIECPKHIYDLDRRAQIWRYCPSANEWERVFRAPLVEGQEGEMVPRDIGYRAMAVFDAPERRGPGLYVTTWAPSRSGRPPLILRSGDGEEFRTLAPLGTDPSLNTYRALVPFDRRLFTSPTGKTAGWSKGAFQGSMPNLADAPAILESSDPASRSWRQVSSPGFGDATNQTIWEMTEFNGHLYAGTLNPATGLQVWRTNALGRPPYRWARILTHGGYRGNLNECATSMCVFNNALYIGTGIQDGGYDKKHKIGPAAAELIRIHPDGTWDLIVGTPRSTPDGYKEPLSGMGPGFDDDFNGYIWRMVVHDGFLYAGTFKWSTFLRYLPIERWPAGAAERIRGIGVDRIIEEDGGFDLWRTSDGVHWSPVTTRGFGNPYNYGIRTMVSTEHGLFVGTANPFGKKVAIPTRHGWEYQENPRGGLEIWLGSPEVDADEMNPEITAIEIVSPPQPPREHHEIVRRLNSKYDQEMYEPAVRRYYGGTDFYNFGYWTPQTLIQMHACYNLMEQLLMRIPSKSGIILDVACGKGATTAYLLKYYSPEQVIGINISEKQLERCRQNAPGCDFRLMDATRLELPDCSVDNVICVEAAFHFDTRERFLREVYRVLKPGGTLALSDILMADWAEAQNPHGSPHNYVPDLTAYHELYRRCGFDPVFITDATDECLTRFLEHSSGYITLQMMKGQLDWWTYRRMLERKKWTNQCVNYYVLVGATKPIRQAGLGDTY